MNSLRVVGFIILILVFPNLAHHRWSLLNLTHFKLLAVRGYVWLQSTTYPTNGALNEIWLTGGRPALVQCLLGIIKYLGCFSISARQPAILRSFSQGERPVLASTLASEVQRKEQEAKAWQLLNTWLQRALFIISLARIGSRGLPWPQWSLGSWGV